MLISCTIMSCVLCVMRIHLCFFLISFSSSASSCKMANEHHHYRHVTPQRQEKGIYHCSRCSRMCLSRDIQKIDFFSSNKTFFL
ncbi:hypothetical protein BDF14DRAFT_1798627 [Spinellus fusiger]|nr:hypothetical protein BDF14DRAFT_1798627 [Spinellus fusiger]